MRELSKHPEWFRKWQQRFYNSKDWRELRQQVRNDKRMRCDSCHKFIRGKSICDHIIEITPANKDDEDITLNADNLQLLCLACHNTKTFSNATPQHFDVCTRNDVNLF